jgi:hypothetical protein
MPEMLRGDRGKYKMELLVMISQRRKDLIKIQKHGGNFLEQSVKGRMHQNGNGTVKSTKNLYLHKENGSLV